MHLFTGTFNALEEHLLSFISENKHSPLDKILVVLPSQRLQKSLNKALADRNTLVSGISFSNFSALSAVINASLKEDSKPLLPAGALQDYIIKNIVRDLIAKTPSRGYCRALKAAFRDLIAAEVTMEDLINLKTADEHPQDDNSIAIEKDEQPKPLLDEEQKAILENFIRCYDHYLKQIQKDGFYTYGDFFKLAVKNTKQSAYLKNFKQIIFYGFYDFTALQFNLFKEICLNFDTFVYFPYQDSQPYSFIKNFYEAYIFPLAKSNQNLAQPKTTNQQAAENIFVPANPKTENTDMRFISVSGVSAEVQAAAKEILMLKETHNIPFNKIALMARSMEPYKYDIPSIFAQNKIPVNYSFEFPLFTHPLAAFVYNLLNLGRNDFYNADVCAVLSSPYFTLRQNKWRDIIKSSGISGGLPQWHALANLCDKRDEQAKQDYLQNAAQITQTISDLNIFYTKLEDASNFKGQSELAITFIDTFTHQSLPDAEQNIMQIIKDIIRDIGGFAQIRQQSSRGEFMEELLCALKEATFNKANSFDNAVEAADIMALRGQHFEAAVFLGMNEGLLPATPAPDPVLKEEYRALLQKIGFLLHTQNERYFEEKLLFTIALSSINKKCSFIFERSGDDGKPKIPSLYLSRLAESVSKSLKNPDLFLSRRENEKLQQWPFELLSQKEAAAYAALNFVTNQQALNIAFNPENQPSQTLPRQLQNAPFMAFNKPGMNFYDGIIEQDNNLHKKINSDGLSPSSMRDLWLCPASYLLKKIVRRDIPINYDRAKIPANKKGSLHHKILEDFYKFIKDRNLLSKLFATGAGELFDNFATPYLSPEKYTQYGLYPLVWKTLSTEIKSNLKHLIIMDIEYMQANNFEPSFFEHKVQAEVIFDSQKLSLHGNVDRIDINPSNNTCRIVDYKTSKEGDSFLKAIFRNGLLQPPLYMLMVENSKDEALKNLQPQQTVLLAIEEKGKPEKIFTKDNYEAIKTDFEQAVNYRLELARTGAFLITPSTKACAYCPYEDICRKDHTPSLKRAKTSQQARKLRSINAGK